MSTSGIRKLKSERIKMVRSMEFIARQINNEDIFEGWLMCGVADGDINGAEHDEDLEYYVEDDNFAELMDLFLHLMSKANKDGGLYCDGIVSKPNDK